MIKCDIKNFKLTAGEYVGLPCKAPCSLYSVLLDSRLVDSPSYRENFRETRDIPKSCEFTATVSLNKVAAESPFVYLCLSGIYGEAEVFFNGKSRGILAFPERKYIIDISDDVVEGANTLTLSFTKQRPPVFEAELSEGLVVPSGDAPALPDFGILGECEILATATAIIDKVSVNQRHTEDSVELDIRLTTLGISDDIRAVVTLISPVGRMYFGSVLNGRGLIRIPDPQYWWPNGLGEPYIYTLTVTLYHGEEAQDMRELKLGLRRIDIAEGEGGVKISVNGREIMPFALTYESEDIVLPYITEKKTEELLRGFATMGGNTLRVKRDTCHPYDTFYDICDKLGILVIEGICVPYTNLSDHPEFNMSVSERVSDLYYRLSHHPSVVFCEASVCLEEGGDIPPNEHAVKDFLLTVTRVAGAVASGFDSTVGLYPIPVFSGDRGDSISLPPYKTAREFTVFDDRNLTSPVMEAHTARPERIPEMLTELIKEYRLPSGFEDTVYTSSLLSAEKYKRLVNEQRLRRDTTLRESYPLLNDCWPSVSTSAVDSFGRLKALHYICRRAFAPVLAILRAEGGIVMGAISNESLKDFTGKITYALYDASDKCLSESELYVACPAGAVTELESRDLSSFMTESLSEYFLFYELRDETRVISRKTLRFVPDKHFRFRDPEIRSRISGGGRDYEITLAASAYAAGVELDFTDIDVSFSDNYFDIMESLPVKIFFRTEEITSAERLENMLTVRSVYDIGKYTPEHSEY